jgi:transposase
MAKYKRYDYSQRVLIPVSLEEQLIPGTLEFAIHSLIENRMDMSVFEDRYNNDETGRSAYDPKILLKVVLLGYSRGLISSRKIERACMENVVFMALCCGAQPDHSTIAGFVSSMKDELLPLYRDILLVCAEEDLLGGTIFALDGCKLTSNASKDWSGRFSDLKKKQEKIEKKVSRLLEEQVREDKRGDDDHGEGGSSSGLSNRKKQIAKLEKQADRIKRFLEENGPKTGKRGREIPSNITDNESCKLITSRGMIQGYNAQALVDDRHQVILHAEAFGESQDHQLIPPMLDGAKGNMDAIGKGNDYFEGKTLTADSNYHDPINLAKCEEEKLDAYIPDKRFRRRDPSFRNDERRKCSNVSRFTLKDFHHDKVADKYFCPNNKVLSLQAKNVIQKGVIYRRYAADKADCTGCEMKAKCITNKKGKRRTLIVTVGHVPGNLSKAMADKVDSEKGRKIYHRRIGIVEPVFANIETNKGMDRFTLRGKIKVNIQWLLYSMVHNIGKIAVYGST